MVERSQGSINIKKVTKMVRRWETVWYGMTEKVGVFKNNNNNKNLPDHAFHWHPIRYWLGKRTLPAWQFGPPPCLSESPLPKYCYTPIFPPLFYHPFISSLHNYLTQFTKMQIWQHHFSAKSHSVASYDLKDKWVSCCQANLQGRWRCWFLCVMYHLFLLPFLLVAQVSSAWLTCSSVNTLFLPATTLSHLYLPVLAPRGDATRLSSLPTPISQLPAPFLHLPFKTQLKHSLPFLSRLSWLLQPELSPPSYVSHSILFSISTTSFITFLKFILIMHCLLR